MDIKKYEKYLFDAKYGSLRVEEIEDEYKTPKLQLLMVRSRGSYIRYIKNPSDEICMEAIKNQSLAIKWIPNPSEEMCLEAISSDPSLIEYIEKPTLKVCLTAIKERKEVFKYIRNQTLEIVKGMIEYHPKSLELTRYIDLENPEVLRYILENNIGIDYSVKHLSKDIPDDLKLLLMMNHGLKKDDFE